MWDDPPSTGDFLERKDVSSFDLGCQIGLLGYPKNIQNIASWEYEILVRNSWYGIFIQIYHRKSTIYGR